MHRQRPAGDRKSADELTKKLLLAIIPDLSPSMAADAFKELRAPAADRRYCIMTQLRVRVTMTLR